MADSNDAKPKLRNARACEACRASKSRCIYKSQAGICQRCEQNSSQCVVRTKARPMRTRAVNPATAIKKQSPGSNDSGFLFQLPAIPSPDSRDNVAALHRHHEHLFDDEEEDSSESMQGDHSESPRKPASEGPLIQKRKITLKQAELLLLSFRQKAKVFPFVHIPAKATVPSLSRSSPFLLLAILTTASMPDPPLYHQMDHEFRRVLSAKIIVEGRKSLDFLQGLLVYIAWTGTLFMRALGLDQELPNLSPFSAIHTDGLIEFGAFTKAAKRACLGCYHISSAICQAFQKPNNMQYRSFMDTYGQALLEDDHSADIHSLVTLQRLAERIGEFHSSKQGIVDFQMQSLTLEMNIQIFLNELQEWRNTTPDVVRNSSFVGIAERFVAITIYSQELGFLRRPFRNPGLVNLSAPLTSQLHLDNCLEACKVFFNYLLSIPESSYVHFTTGQWGFMVQAIIILSRLTFLMAAKLDWDAETAREKVPLVMYLDCLCYRFQVLSNTAKESPSSPSPDAAEPDIDQPPKSPNAFYVFRKILTSVKTSYERRVSYIRPNFFAVDHGNLAGDARGHCPMSNPEMTGYLESEAVMGYENSMESLMGSGTSSGTTGDWREGSERDSSSGSGSSSAPLWHDLWATMTGSWAEEF